MLFIIIGFIGNRSNPSLGIPGIRLLQRGFGD